MGKLKKAVRKSTRNFLRFFLSEGYTMWMKNLARPTKAGHSEEHEEMTGSFKRPVGPETLP